MHRSKSSGCISTMKSPTNIKNNTSSQGIRKSVSTNAFPNEIVVLASNSTITNIISCTVQEFPIKIPISNDIKSDIAACIMSPTTTKTPPDIRCQSRKFLELTFMDEEYRKRYNKWRRRMNSSSF